jgi:pimeloyl-ACP methyl ester carboxylesterase
LILWGSSYGATWTQRILQLDDQGLITAAIMDSTATATPETALADNMLKVAESGDTLFEACAADEHCAERFGPDPKARALEILDDLCEPLNGEYRGRRWFQSMLSSAMRGWDSLRLVPPLIHRAGRCDEEDVRFIERFYREDSGSGGRRSYDSAPRSTALLYTILFSELVPSASTADELTAAGETSVFADLVGAEDLVVGYDAWPTYPRDEYMFELANTDTDLLILHGGLDTQTPPSMGRDMESHFNADNHQYFYFPLGTHGVYWGSHTAERPERFGPIDPDDRYACGQHLTWQFIDDPSSRVDGSCVDNAQPLEFGTAADTLFDLAGHDDPWDNP